MRVRGWSVKSFEDATTVIKYLNFLLALRILERPRGQLRPYLTMIYVTCVSFLLVGKTVNLDGVEIFKDYLFKFESFLYQSMYSATLLALNIFCVFGLCNSRQFLKYKKLVMKVEEEIQELGGWIDNPAVFKRSLVCICLWFFYMMISAILYTRWISKETSSSVGVTLAIIYSFGEIVDTIVLIDFVTAVHWLKLSYEQANLLLCKDFRGSHIPRTNSEIEFDEEGQINSVTGNLSSNTKAETSTFVRLEAFQSIKVLPKFWNERLWIWKIRQIHLELCRLTRFLFQIFGIQIAIEVGLSLMLMTGNLYYFYVELSSWRRMPNNYGKLSMLSGVSCIALGMKLYLICATCEYTHREVKYTNEILYSLPYESSDFEFKEEVRQFALQITQSEQSFVVYGFPRLNFKFIRMFFNLVTTYLVITIQMSDTFQSDEDGSRNNSLILL